MSLFTPLTGRQARPVVEWIIGALSGGLVLALIFYLGYRAVLGAAKPVDLRLTIERIERLDTGTIVRVSVANRGDAAVAGVTVNAAAVGSSGVAAHKHIMLDYIAAHGLRRGAFLFSGPITADGLVFDIGGFTEP